MAVCKEFGLHHRKTPMSFYSANLSPVETGLIIEWETIWEKYCAIECFHVLNVAAARPR